MELTGRSVSLPAIEPEWAAEARADPWLLGDIAHAVGGPFHVLHPERYAANLASFQRVLDAAGVSGQVYFGKKANKSGCWLTECARAGAGVDVASEPELVHSMGNGMRGADLVVTGAAKSERLLWLAMRQHSLIAVDALDELDRIIELARTCGPARLLLRVLPEHNPHSRFGLGEDELDHAIRRCARETDVVAVEGFSFHLNGYAVAPRAELAARLVDRCVDARRRGLAADSISIGGGFAVSYVDESAWQRFTDQQRAEWFHGNKEFTHFYPYHNAVAGSDMLSSILDSRIDGETVADKFVRTGTRMLLEPGRALLDGCGFTVFPVQGFKERGAHGIVTVHGLSMSVSEQWKGSEFLPDPLLWPESPGGSPVSACVGGASCLDYDMLTWRKVAFPRSPEFGDLLIYPNTAGYQMDKNETEFHQIPLPARVVLHRDDARFRWRISR